MITNWFPAINFGILVFILGQMIVREYLRATEARSMSGDVERIKARVEIMEDRLRHCEMEKCRRNNPAG